MINTPVHRLMLVVILSMLSVVTCSNSEIIEFRGLVLDQATQAPLGSVEVWCMAGIDHDTLAPFPNHVAALTQIDGTYKDEIDFSPTDGCASISADEWLHDGAYFRFQESGYETLDTLFIRRDLWRVSGYYRVPEIRMKPLSLKTRLGRPGGDR